MDWTGIFKTIGTTGIIVALIGYFLRQVFQQVLSRDLKRFESDLIAKHDIEVERLRNDLRIAAAEHETRFSQLHETRMSTIAELYARLVSAHEAFDSYLSMAKFPGEPDDLVKGEEARKRARELIGYFSEKRIYFDEELCTDLDEAFEQLRKAYVWKASTPAQQAGGMTQWAQAAMNFGKHFPPIRSKIEQQFRELIGVPGPRTGTQRTTGKGK